MASFDEATSASSVLVVDDNEANRSLARMTLVQEGYVVRVAATGEDALRQFEASPADCVLLDVRMPGLDGPTVCERLRALPQGANVAIIFLTALRDVATFDRAIRAGGDEFLTKPIQPDELVLRVGAALKVRRLDVERMALFETVRQQRDALLRVQLQKDQLMAFIVHDLMNPVTSIDLNVQMLLSDAGVAQPVMERITNIQTSTRALTRMILNLLDISRADEGQLRPVFETIDLAVMLAELFRAFEVKARARSVGLGTALEIGTLRADRALLLRVLENLIENALRYAPQSSRVTVAACAREGAVEIRVCDAGRGVPEASRERIFERFVQIGGPEQRGGRGLGLAFCRHAVEAHGGRISCEDGAPGAVFCVVIPQSAG